MTRRSPLPPLSRRRFLAASAVGAALAGWPRPAPAETEMRREVSQHGVTFRFAEPRPVGRYATGDWFVVGPVTLKEITPAGDVFGDPYWNYWRHRPSRAIHGAQLDWFSEDRRRQGLDGIVWRGRFNLFDDRANVDPGYTARPLRVERPATVIKAVSLPAAKVGRHLRPCLSDMVFLTVVDEVPPRGSFRPSAEPGDKRARWSEADLDWSILPALPRPEGADHVWDYAALAARHARPHWNSHSRFDMNRPMMAANNQPNYGREHAWETGYALLALCRDAPRTEKRALFVALVQQGLDLAAMVNSGRPIKAADGNSIGRAAPLALAATALGGEDLRAAADGGRFTASEHGQFFHVGSPSIELRRVLDDRPRGPYTQDMRGVPEFGGQHLRPGSGEPMQPRRSGSHFEMDYRDIVSNPLVPAAAAAHAIRGMAEAWNQPAFFEYMDRWTGITRYQAQGGTRRARQGNDPSPLALAHYQAWRDLSPIPRHPARPEVMNRSFYLRRLGMRFTRGAPLLAPVVGGFDAHPLLNPHRDSSLDRGSRLQIRISRDGETWELAGELPFGQGGRLEGLERGARHYVQMRQVHPERGAGPWSFDWTWWRDDVFYEGRWSLDGRSWTHAGRLGDGAAMLDWLARTHRREAPFVQVRRNRARKEGAFAPWVSPPWLSPDLDFEVPGAGAGGARRNAAFPPSVVTL